MFWLKIPVLISTLIAGDDVRVYSIHFQSCSAVCLFTIHVLAWRGQMCISTILLY